MRARPCTTIFLLAFALISQARAAEIYQWIDESGIIHFTDDPERIPASAPQLPSFAVREFAETPKDTGREAAPQPPPPGQPSLLEPPPAPAEPAPFIYYAPQEVTIVVSNSSRRRFHKPPCKVHCGPSFRPDFNDRRYIHPSVFNGGSRQYIQPGKR
ncbi:MAG TPA: DUF4124 domain-containing protein [Candidatus Eisenbacteria bacterium]|nr:DUF4124 domain-containing protein [Candidatus Eisenbacteria bacterium]